MGRRSSTGYRRPAHPCARCYPCDGPLVNHSGCSPPKLARVPCTRPQAQPAPVCRQLLPLSHWRPRSPEERATDRMKNAVGLILSSPPNSRIKRRSLNKRITPTLSVLQGLYRSPLTMGHYQYWGSVSVTWDDRLGSPVICRSSGGSRGGRGGPPRQSPKSRFVAEPLLSEPRRPSTRVASATPGQFGHWCCSTATTGVYDLSSTQGRGVGERWSLLTIWARSGAAGGCW